MDLAAFYLIVLSVVAVVLLVVFYWMLKKRKATLRFLAFMFGVLTLGLGGFFWYATQDSTTFIVCIGATISQSALILSIPRIAPAQFKILEKNLGIRW
jgi:intracellular septation protein A